MNNNKNNNSSNTYNLFDFYSQIYDQFANADDICGRSRSRKSQSEIEGLRAKVQDDDYMTDAIKGTADIIIKSEGKKWN